MKYGEVNLKEMTLEECSEPRSDRREAHSLSMPGNTILRHVVQETDDGYYEWVLYGFPVGGSFDKDSKPLARSPEAVWRTEQEARQAYLDVQGAIVINRLRDEMAWRKTKCKE